MRTNVIPRFGGCFWQDTFISWFFIFIQGHVQGQISRSSKQNMIFNKSKLEQAKYLLLVWF